MKNQVVGIYKITNSTNGKYYIGSSRHILSRWKRHIWELMNNRHPNKHLQAAFNKTDISDWCLCILEFCSLEDLLVTEQKYLNIMDFNTNYNMATEAKGGGSNTMTKPLYVLDLEGNIIKKCISGAEAKRFIGRNNILNYSTINTPSVNQKRYRIVTPEFYSTNKGDILGWKTTINPKVQIIKQKIYLNSLRRIKVFKEDKIYFFKTLGEVGGFLNITGEAVRLILKKENRLHKKTGFKLERVSIEK